MKKKTEDSLLTKMFGMAKWITMLSGSRNIQKVTNPVLYMIKKETTNTGMREKLKEIRKKLIKNGLLSLGIKSFQT